MSSAAIGRSIRVFTVLSMCVLLGCATSESDPVSPGDGSDDREPQVREGEDGTKASGNPGNETEGESMELREEDVLYRINAGADQDETLENGETWLADQMNRVGEKKWGATGGNAVYRGEIAIAGTDRDPIYRYERWGVPSYSFDVPNGTYTVRLHFAENYHGVTKPGDRVFSVNVEGESVLKSLDIFREAGERQVAVTRTIRGVRVTDGELNVEFKWGERQPVINGMEVVRNG